MELLFKNSRLKTALTNILADKEYTRTHIKRDLKTTQTKNQTNRK